LTTDPHSARGPEWHLTLFESAISLAETVAAWSEVGPACSSPMTADTILFGVEGSPPASAPESATARIARRGHLVTVGR